MSTQLNKDQICSVTICYNDLNSRYKYYEEKRGLFRKRKAGFYYTYTLHDPIHFSNEDIEKDTNLVIKDKEVYYKPNILIRMSDGHSYQLYFETVEELKTYMNKEPMKSIKWVNEQQSINNN